MKAKQLWVIVVMAALSIVTGASIAMGQEVVLEPGDTLTVLVLELPPIVVPPPETTFVDVPVPGPTVYDCPIDFDRLDDGESWTCEAPVEVDTLPPLIMARPRASIVGDSLIVTWTPNPSPDSRGIHTTSYRVRGGNNTSGVNLPFVTVTGTRHAWKLPLPGKYWVCTTPQNAAGEPQSSCIGIIYAPVISSLNEKIETCLTFMRERQEGIYYSPAADACVKLASITDRDEVNRIHAAYWRAIGDSVHDDPFPRTVTTLEVLPQA